MKTVIIKPVHVSKFSGISGHRNTKTTIGAEYRMDGSYKTGLSKEDEAKYEKELGLKPGELSNRSTWWGDNIAIRLNNDKPTFLYVDGPMNELKYKVLLESTKVANDETEIGKFPTIGFVIHDEEAKAAKESEIVDTKTDAYELLATLSNEDRRGLLKVISSQSKTNRRGINELSDKVVKTYLAKELESDPKNFIKTAKDPILKAKIFVADLLEADLIRRTGNFFRNGEDIIANSSEEVVDYFMNPKNESIRLALESKLKKSKKD